MLKNIYFTFEIESDYKLIRQRPKMSYETEGPWRRSKVGFDPVRGQSRLFEWSRDKTDKYLMKMRNETEGPGDVQRLGLTP